MASVQIPQEFNFFENRVGYAPPSAYVTDIDSDPAQGPADQLAIQYLRENASDFGLDASDLSRGTYRISSQHTSNHTGVTHVYFQQMKNGLDVLNAVGSVNVMPDGSIHSAAMSFVPGIATGGAHANPDMTPDINAISAVHAFANEFGLTVTENPEFVEEPVGTQMEGVVSDSGISLEPIPVNLQFVPVEDGGVELAWRVNVQTRDLLNWSDAYVNADSGDLMQMNNWVANASYTVIPLPARHPAEQAPVPVVDPHDPIASPFGWHDTNGQPGAEFTDTRGNNVFAQEDLDADDIAGRRPSGGPALQFTEIADFTLDPLANENAAITNLFYWNNIVHDVLYQYGFDEASGNFQAINYTGLGLASDQVIADALDGSGFDNANFATPPDGQSGRMQQFIFTQTTPRRDSSFSNNVIVHEYGHGVTNRLTGGAADAAALVLPHSGAMGEGWSDFFGLMFQLDPTDQANDAVAIGDWVEGNPGGVRRNPYSLDLSINPITMRDFDLANLGVHDNGEMWASALWDLNWLLVDKYGFDPDLYRGAGGNNLAMQLVMDALKLQPANPSYLDARDAVLQADLILNRGANHYEIWEAFARRGLGFSLEILVAGNMDPAETEDVCSAAAPINCLAPGFDTPDVQSVSGTVYFDRNADGVRNGGDTGLAGVQVWLDLDNDNNIDRFEQVVVSGPDGSYEFEFRGLGSNQPFVIRQVPPAGFFQTEPVNGGGQVVLVGNTDVENIDFGNASTDIAGISGFKWSDLDADGTQDANEPFVEGITIYVDVDDDGRLDIGEPAAKTDANGFYNIVDALPSGTFKIREVMHPGWQITSPSDGYHELELGPLPHSNINFGNNKRDDFGDLPDTYGTTLRNSGAVHGIWNGFQLGSSVDAEVDGQVSTNGDGDGLDEDGVVFTSALFAGVQGTVDVTVSVGDLTPGLLNAWIDFDHSGSFDPDEQIFRNARLPGGTHQLPFQVPGDAVIGPVNARFRYGFETDLGPTGRAIAGEVEDHVALILDDVPDARDDVFQADQNTLTQLDVLANDFISSNGGLDIVAVSDPSSGGTVAISPDAQTVVYTSAPTFSGTETFTYTVEDSAGNRDTATVAVTVVPTFIEGIAIDDMFRNTVAPGTVNNTLDVLANDIPGINPPLTILGVGTPLNGNATIDRRGTADPTDDVILYTPNQDFTHFDQFTYTIGDNASPSVLSTATVTVKNDAATDVLAIRGSFTDLNGNPITEAGVGERFLLNVSIQDIRDPLDALGVFAAYSDVLFDATKLIVDGPITFTDDYNQVPSGATDVPGIGNEVGSVQNGLSPLGGAEFLQYTIEMRAIGETSRTTVNFDPADVSPAHDSLLQGVNVAITPDLIRYQGTNLEITADGNLSGGGGGNTGGVGGGDESGGENEGGGTGEGTFQNPRNAMDVNDDGHISPIDVLLVVNLLNEDGPGPLEGEGESSGIYPDVTGDQHLSPVDALTIINFLNLSNAQEGEGEGEALVGTTSPGSSVNGFFGPVSVEQIEQGATPSDFEGNSMAELAELPLVDNSNHQVAESTPQEEALDVETELDDVLDLFAEDVDEIWGAI